MTTHQHIVVVHDACNPGNTSSGNCHVGSHRSGHTWMILTHIRPRLRQCNKYIIIMGQYNIMSMNGILSKKMCKTKSLNVIDVTDVLYRNTFKSRLLVTII